ncbi:hypothetical protein RJ641_011653 [Dillenia turbinata]|uniref:Uncharacterized protein n=1 Tax=Dillenia turbinata TaxID=194707 RepID=A0AAN8UYV8_9MAGN
MEALRKLEDVRRVLVLMESKGIEKHILSSNNTPDSDRLLAYFILFLVTDLHMDFLSISEFLVEVSDDLFDYEDDVLEYSFNILRMFVRIHGASKAQIMLLRPFFVIEALNKFRIAFFAPCVIGCLKQSSLFCTAYADQYLWIPFCPNEMHIVFDTKMETVNLPISWGPLFLLFFWSSAAVKKKYERLLRTLDPKLASRYRIRCEEATMEGGNISGYSLGTWSFPPVIEDEDTFIGLNLLCYESSGHAKIS